VQGTVSGPGRVSVTSTMPRIQAAAVSPVQPEPRGPQRRRTE
jgi:hypothetical protein